MGILIIADDLSGAADCAVGFACAGLRTFVALQPHKVQMLGPADALAVDTDTRRLPPADAAARTAALYAALKCNGRRLYKKIDSTLRGPWAAEVAGLVSLAGLAIVAPAHPALGRTVKDGGVFLHGEPLERSETWRLEHSHQPADITSQLRDAGVSVATLHVDAALDEPAALAQRIGQLAGQGVDALVIGAETVEALRALARATLSIEHPMFWVGSGGLAREIAALLPASPADPGEAVMRSPGPTLIVAGSLSAVTERQVTRLTQCEGIQTIVVPPGILRGGVFHEGWVALQARIGKALGDGIDVLLRIDRDDRFDPAEGVRFSAALAHLAGPHFARIGCLVATGGETARAMLVEVGVAQLRVLSELETGVIVGVPAGTGRSHHPWVVTKAGAFGTDETLLNAWQSVRSSHADMPGALPPCATSD